MLARLQTIQPSAIIVPDKERIVQIAYRLLMSTEPLTAQELADAFYVSRNTIRSDLDLITDWLAPFHLRMVTRQRIGMVIEGESVTNDCAGTAEPLADTGEPAGKWLKSQFAAHEVDTVYHELEALCRRHQLDFTDETFDSLVIHILLISRRIKLGQPIMVTGSEMEEIRQKREYEWASELAADLGKSFAMSFPEMEKCYLALHLLGGKLRYKPDRNDTQPAEKGSEGLSVILVDQLVRTMCSLNLIDFTRDETLISGLHVHLRTTLNRLQYGLPVTNPMLHEIKKMYPYMFDMMVSAVDEINQEYGLTIPEEEMAYLTLHFQAAVERLNHSSRKHKQVVIVCHMGVGMSQLLSSRIERKFYAVHVAGCIGLAELDEFLRRHQVDMIISTIELPPVSVPYIVISPLLEAGEEKKLELFIQKSEHTQTEKPQESILLKYTTPFLVLLQQQADHPYEIIERLGQLLHQKGFVTAEYIHSAIIREKMSATTIGMGVAIPHGSPQHIVQSAIAIATLQQPLRWGNEYVSLVFMLAVQNEDQQETRLLFRELSGISENPLLVQRLREQQDVMTFLSGF
ncbi:BglG family transcription antiterminator [Paenibacillus bovis]|uniref:BglG family transcription antiterminator n=1 Tax=Paenibacillus bovis TaxID=1616788 RepID=UPI000761644B|nr:BglG family transcription antiterminator [Paenibacillus bovis]